MKRIEEKLASGYMVRYISNCLNCPNFSKIGGSKCLQYNNLVNLSPAITMSYIDAYNNEIYTIPSWCGLEDYNTGRYTAYGVYQRNDYVRKPIKDITCSYCNIEDDTVERKNNNGMCSKCLEKSKFNNDILIKAKLNNFKLKRINKNKYSNTWITY